MTWAKLIKMETGNGLWRIDPDKAQLGKMYTIKSEKPLLVHFHNTRKDVDHSCECLQVWDEHEGQFQWFPLELLEIQK